ncbi:tetratricopeptide repeat protein [Porphyrobacter algicida]|uniref:Tetratricopeptide repeat protein n=1 Tax=Qipengyuania algicida TaxID=1836209 RepID=A0A845AG91_9SPHN|nr:tetratricopeptide repeat protein [Qipengyuania algicida]
MNTQTDKSAKFDEALHMARSGRTAEARSLCKTILQTSGERPDVHAFLGMLDCREGRFEDGIEHLSQALKLRPDDVTIALNMATALMQLGRNSEALDICTDSLIAKDQSLRLLRTKAYLLQTLEDNEGAIVAYRRILDAVPDDFEALNNLGNSYAAAGQMEESLVSLRKAHDARPDIAPLTMNLATTLLQLGQIDEARNLLEDATARFPRDAKPRIELAGIHRLQGDDDTARRLFEEAIALEPSDPELRVRLGIELAKAWKMTEAEESFDRALSIDPRNGDAHIRKALILEHTNRYDQLTNLIDAARSRGIDQGTIDFIRALHLRREKAWEEGIEVLSNVPEDIEPVRRFQLLGQFHDSLGNAEAAFEAFSAMNEQVRTEQPATEALASDYRREIRDGIAELRKLKAPAVLNMQASAPARTPAFLVGFPRSGTTLLDTLLLGHPSVQVLEERPPLNVAEEVLNQSSEKSDFSASEVEAAREAYFTEADKWIDLRPDSLLVDKFPLHMNKVPSILALFPNPRFILALRHPCDVVLSCYITNFRPNKAMSNFLNLKTVAELYDLSFTCWEAARSHFSLDVHEIVYEKMLDNSRSELQPVFEFLGLDWREEILDHQQTAVSRGVITTASYGQVTEPLYRRAMGRWERYREQLEPVLPILQPWIEKFGYST